MREEVAEMLDEIHRATFLDSAPVPSFDEGYWWLAFHGSLPAAFAGLVQSTYAPNAGSLCRARGDEEGLGPVAAVAFAASGSKACASERLASYRLRHDQQRHIGQQLHPGRLSALPAELALGVGQHALLAQIRVRAAVPAGHTANRV
jgi:hypothetical protein